MILLAGGESDWNFRSKHLVQSEFLFHATYSRLRALHVTMAGGEDSRGMPAFRCEDACKYVLGVQDVLRFL